MKLSNRLFVSVLVFIAILLIGTVVYHNLEGWRYLDSLYFTVITVTTIGYGDLVIKTDAGKIFTMFFAFAGIGMAFYFISLIGRYMFRQQLRGKLEESGRIRSERGIHRIPRK